MIRAVAIALIMSVTGAFPGPATWAADAANHVVASASVWPSDLTSALNVVLVAAATVVASVITTVGVRLAKKLGLDVTAQDRMNMEAEITAALNAGISKLLPLIATHGWNKSSVHEAILTNAADYLRQRFPSRVAKITAAARRGNAPDATVSSTTALTETLAARLPAVIKTAASSPATSSLPPDKVRNTP